MAENFTQDNQENTGVVDNKSQADLGKRVSISVNQLKDPEMLCDGLEQKAMKLH